MTQVQNLIEAGYVTRKQAAEILGKGDGGNITKLCKAHGVKFIEIPRGETKVTTLFLGGDVRVLAGKLTKKRAPKQAELAKFGGFRVENNDPVPNNPPAQEYKCATDTTTDGYNAEMMRMLCAIDAKLTALLKRGEAV